MSFKSGYSNRGTRGGSHGSSHFNSHSGSTSNTNSYGLTRGYSYHSTSHTNPHTQLTHSSTSNSHTSSRPSGGGGENPTRRLMVHLTDPDAAASILKTRTMRPGTGGLLGAGIYFCKTMDGCDWRALHHGTYILAEVYLGKTEADLNLDNRPQDVHSTVSGDRLPMYVVNEPDRVKNIRFLDGTFPPKTNVNDIELRSRMPLIFVASPQDAANFIENRSLPVENRPEIAGKGFYLWQNIPDAKKFAKGGSATYLAADVYFNNCFEGHKLKKMPSQADIASHDSFRGIYNGTHFFMVKNPKDVDKIHYIGGVRPPPAKKKH